MVSLYLTHNSPELIPQEGIKEGATILLTSATNPLEFIVAVSRQYSSADRAAKSYGHNRTLRCQEAQQIQIYPSNIDMLGLNLPGVKTQSIDTELFPFYADSIVVDSQESLQQIVLDAINENFPTEQRLDRVLQPA